MISTQLHYNVNKNNQMNLQKGAFTADTVFVGSSSLWLTSNGRGAWWYIQCETFPSPQLCYLVTFAVQTSCLCMNDMVSDDCRKRLDTVEFLGGQRECWDYMIPLYLLHQGSIPHEEHWVNRKVEGQWKVGSWNQKKRAENNYVF